MGTSDQPVPAEADGGKYISLATDLSPEPVVVKEETTQSKLLERWTRNQAVANQGSVTRQGSETANKNQTRKISMHHADSQT